jgi:hypothetical protein
MGVPGMDVPGTAIPRNDMPCKQFEHSNNLGLALDALLVAL